MSEVPKPSTPILQWLQTVTGASLGSLALLLLGLLGAVLEEKLDKETLLKASGALIGLTGLILWTGTITAIRLKGRIAMLEKEKSDRSLVPKFGNVDGRTLEILEILFDEGPVIDAVVTGERMKMNQAEIEFHWKKLFDAGFASGITPVRGPGGYQPLSARITEDGTEFVLQRREDRHNLRNSAYS